MKKEIIVVYEEFADRAVLDEIDKQLLNEADKALAKAYAPYSNFHVAAAALLENNEIISAANQENASYPAGICAERNLLATVSAIHPGVSIQSIAITYQPLQGESNHPISPCGICRQSILEYQTKQKKPVRIILAGQQGKIFIMPSVESLLPFSFSAADLNV